jgi:hypothetical protein
MEGKGEEGRGGEGRGGSHSVFLTMAATESRQSEE